MVERRFHRVEPMAAVNAAPAAVAHRGTLECALDVARKKGTAALPITPSWVSAAMAKETELPTSSHFTSPEKATPRTGRVARGGVSRVDVSEVGAVTTRPAALGPSSRQRRGSVPGDVRRQTSIGLQALGSGRGRRLPYDITC
jgi:hypothetical protein